MSTVDPAVLLVAKIVLTYIFLLAGAHKLRDLRAFVATLRDYRIMPEQFVPAGAYLVTSLELAAVAGLFFATTSRIAALILVALLTAYAFAIGLNLVRGRSEIDCGCSGPGARQSLSGWLIVRNGVIAGVAALCLLPRAVRVLHWVDLITVLLGSAVFILIYQAASQLIANAPKLRELRASR